MDGVSLSWRLLPETIIERHGLKDRMIRRTDKADPEYQFLYRQRGAMLPVWYGDELRIFNWGSPARSSPLPRCRVIGHEDLHAGIFQQLQPEAVEIPATFGLDRGIWYPVKEGIQGVMVREQDGSPVVYVVTRESTHYYEVMTRNKREPIFIGQMI